MAKKKPEESSEQGSTVVAPTPRPDIAQVIVYDPRGNPHRTYSFEVHGEAYEKLAAEFISDRKGWTVR